MEWSFRLLLIFAAAFALAAVDHYLFDNRLAAAMPRMF
jgi:hypothetical protein